jgi:hypothetical protein
MSSDNDLAEQMDQMNIQSPLESVGAWDAIYHYMYPELKREYDRNELMYQMMSLEETTLMPDEQEREINRYRNEMMRVIQVRGMLRRLAGYRH